jgi:hypothetical protein
MYRHIKCCAGVLPSRGQVDTFVKYAEVDANGPERREAIWRSRSRRPVKGNDKNGLTGKTRPDRVHFVWRRKNQPVSTLVSKVVARRKNGCISQPFTGDVSMFLRNLFEFLDCFSL